jgi:hypothetical protein
MSIIVQCTCGRRLKARDEFAGKRADCPHCGTELTVPKAVPEPPPLSASDVADTVKATAQKPEQAVEITEFLDPPSTSVKTEKESAWLQTMLEALLDPRSIQWMLILGGGLGVLGLLIWLTTWGIFENPLVLAVALGIGSLAILATGWFIVLKTRYKVAGQAVTFLGCVVAPLNLWFYHAQALVTLDGQLWVGGVVCCLLYAATVYVLRDPLFMYAVEAGITLTVGLLLAEVGMVNELSSLCLVLMGLGLVSIHAERAFAPDGEFARARFGMPLFWSGHAQLAASLLILLGTQAANWLFGDSLRETWQGTLIAQHYLLAGGLWLAGMYAYLYSDIVVRRVGIYTMAAAVCMIMAEVTVAYEFINQEGLIIVLALTAMAATVLQSKIAAKNQNLSRAVPPLAMALSALPVLIGLGLFIRATSPLVGEIMGGDYTIGPWFVASMLVVAIANRVSAYATRHSAPAWSSAYFFISAAALMVTAAGLLRTLGVIAWHQQAPWLMLIPLAYMVASRLWRGHTPAQPLYWVAQASTAVILFHVLAAAATSLESFELMFQPIKQHTQNLLLGLVFVEAAVFYTLGMVFRRRSANVYLAAACACGAMWQLLGYWGMPGPYYTMMFAALGIGLLAVSRAMGVGTVTVYRSTGGTGLAIRGKGLAAFQTGNAIVCVALLAGFLQGLALLATPDDITVPSILALALTIVAAVAATLLVPHGAWRRMYVTSTIALGGLMCLSLNLHIDLSGWQKLEIFSVVVGVLLIAISYVGRFRESDGEENEMVSVGLWLGSLMATVPLVVAVMYYWATGDPSTIDQLALLTVTVLMVLTGYVWQVKSTTFLGGVSLVFYLFVFVVSLSLGLDKQWIIGVYLTIGGGLIFALGVGLSMYRERLLQLPERISKREGVFRILNWR